MIVDNQQVISSNEFHTIDKIVMRYAFDIQNEFGRFCTEKIYQVELARRCADSGRFAIVETEVPLCIFYGDFIKTYQADLIINNAVIYELKATECFSSSNDAQLLN